MDEDLKKIALILFIGLIVSLSVGFIAEVASLAWHRLVYGMTPKEVLMYNKTRVHKVDWNEHD